MLIGALGPLTPVGEPQPQPLPFPPPLRPTGRRRDWRQLGVLSSNPRAAPPKLPAGDGLGWRPGEGEGWGAQAGTGREAQGSGRLLPGGAGQGPAPRQPRACGVRRFRWGLHALCGVSGFGVWPSALHPLRELGLGLRAPLQPCGATGELVPPSSRPRPSPPGSSGLWLRAPAAPAVTPPRGPGSARRGRGGCDGTFSDGSRSSLPTDRPRDVAGAISLPSRRKAQSREWPQGRRDPHPRRPGSGAPEVPSAPARPPARCGRSPLRSPAGCAGRPGSTGLYTRPQAHGAVRLPGSPSARTPVHVQWDQETGQRTGLASTVKWNLTRDIVESDKYVLVNATVKSNVPPFSPASIHLALQVSEFLAGQDNDVHTHCTVLHGKHLMSTPGQWEKPGRKCDTGTVFPGFLPLLLALLFPHFCVIFNHLHSLNFRLYLFLLNPPPLPRAKWGKNLYLESLKSNDLN